MSHMDKDDPMGMALLLDAPAAQTKTSSHRDIDKVINAIEVGSDDDSDEWEEEGVELSKEGGGANDDDEDEDDDGDAEEYDDSVYMDDGGGVAGNREPMHITEQTQYRMPRVDPNVELNEKKELMYQFERLAKKGLNMPRQFNMASDVNEMRAELERLQRDRSMDAAVAAQKKGLFAIVTIIEWLNKTWFPNKVKLSGWAQFVQDDIDAYDELFEEIYVKYSKNGKLKIPVEVRFIFMVVTGAVMCHMSNTVFRNMPEVQETLKKNPKMMRDMAGMAMGMAAKSNAPDQEGANPLMGSIAGLLSNMMGAFGGSSPAPANPHPPPPMQYQQADPPKMRGPQGFDQMMKDIGSMKPPQPSARIETFSTVSDSEISELSGSHISRRGRRRVLNL